MATVASSSYFGGSVEFSRGINRSRFVNLEARRCYCYCTVKSGEKREGSREASGNPLGRKELGKKVVSWLAKGMAEMAGEIVRAEKRNDVESIEEKMGVGSEFVRMVQPFLDRQGVPEGCQEQCEKARSHYPTLYDHFQRELQQALVAAKKEGAVENWQETLSWKLFKKLAKSGEHRLVARIEKQGSGPLGLSSTTMVDIQNKVDAFVERFLELLRIEREAELAATQQTLDRSETVEEDNDADPVLHEECSSLRDLVAITSSKGLGGTEVISFRSKDANVRLPPTSLSPGDMVCVRVSSKAGTPPSTECVRGSVSKLSVDGESIDVAVPGSRALMRLSGRSIRIDKIFDLANATTYERNCEALNHLKKHALQKSNPAKAVVAVLFGQGERISQLAHGGREDEHSPSTPSLSFPDGMFDESQKAGIQLGLNQRRPVVVIQGPPGTGKTSVVTDLIAKAVSRGDRVLATAPTNAAVDNLVDRLGSLGLEVVRVGNPVRMSPTVVSRSLTQIVNLELDEFRRTVAGEKSAIRRALRQPCDAKMKTELEKRLKQLGKAVKRKEEQVPVTVLKSSPVVLCTNIGAGDPLVKKAGLFDLTVIDEAGQAIEPSCWISILRSSRTVFAGDINQLAPTVFSKEALEGGLGTSLMERASSLHSGALNTMLQTQYRMNSAIASWASSEMYGGLVNTAPSVSTQVLSSSPEVEENWRTQAPMLLLDTRQAYGSLAAGCEECMDYLGTGSYFNDGEADIVVEHVMALTRAGVQPSSIAVQSPYLAQVHLLRSRLEEALGQNHLVQVESIDSFQGREADAVVISMVRSNELGLVGFLADKRRINVAVTRARKHVAIVCDSSTVGSNSFLRRLLHHIRMHGVVKSVHPPHLLMEFS